MLSLKNQGVYKEIQGEKLLQEESAIVRRYWIEKNFQWQISSRLLDRDLTLYRTYATNLKALNLSL